MSSSVDLSSPSRIAVVGAGMAGATCAAALTQAGHDVHVFEKSRGVGGRMATRKLQVQQQGTPATTIGHADHGAPYFTAHNPEFKRFLEDAQRHAAVSAWSPRCAAGSFVPLDEASLWLATPDMPALCRHIMGAVVGQSGPTAATVPHLRTQHTVNSLKRMGGYWQLAITEQAEKTEQGEKGEQAAADHFDAVVLAIPPAQAAALLIDHHSEWARRATRQPMLPCWTLIGISDAPTGEQAQHALARPQQGPLATVIRNDLKPGRSTADNACAVWVAHATALWSQTYLEAAPDDVLAHLQAALARWLREPLVWQQAQVHRWRYASVARSSINTTGPCWWDDELALGVCGDFLGGGGVQGAWLSGLAMARAVQPLCVTA
jgi:renalase